MDTNFEQNYTNLENKFIELYEQINEMKPQPYKNNAKLKKAEEQLMDLHIEFTKKRDNFKKQYRIHELIKSVESMNQYIRDDLKELYKKPTMPIPQAPLNKVPNWGRQRSRSFPGALKNIFTRKRGGGKAKKTRKH